MLCLVLRHNCIKIDGDVYTVSGKYVAHGLWFLAYRPKAYADSSGFAGDVVSNESAVVENASFLFRSLYLPFKVPHLFIGLYRNLHGFVRFPVNITARLLFYKRQNA